jgi:hypothetical protein
VVGDTHPVIVVDLYRAPYAENVALGGNLTHFRAFEATIDGRRQGRSGVSRLMVEDLPAGHGGPHWRYRPDYRVNEQKWLSGDPNFLEPDDARQQ